MGVKRKGQEVKKKGLGVKKIGVGLKKRVWGLKKKVTLLKFTFEHFEKMLGLTRPLYVEGYFSMLSIRECLGDMTNGALHCCDCCDERKTVWTQ